MRIKLLSPVISGWHAILGASYTGCFFLWTEELVMPGSLLICALFLCTPHFVKPSNPSRPFATSLPHPFLSSSNISFLLPAKEAAVPGLLSPHTLLNCTCLYPATKFCDTQTYILPSTLQHASLLYPTEWIQVVLKIKSQIWPCLECCSWWPFETCLKQRDGCREGVMFLYRMEKRVFVV